MPITGLVVGQFGVISKDHAGEEAFAGGAGNVFGGTVVKVDSVTYLYHNDEGVNNGVHRWKIPGLASVDVQTAVFRSPLPPTEIAEGVDLMEDLPRNAPLENNTNGWERFPVTDVTTGPEIFYVKTGVRTYDKLKSTDVFGFYNATLGAAYLSRILPAATANTDWAVTGKVSFDGNTRTQFQLKAVTYLEVLNGNNKVIARLDVRQTSDNVTSEVKANNLTMATLHRSLMEPITKVLQPFKISYSNGDISLLMQILKPSPHR